MHDNRDELIATLTHAVHAQHRALDALIARLCLADKTFMPTQWREVWSAVETGHNALEDALNYEQAKTSVHTMNSGVSESIMRNKPKQ